MTSEPEAEEPDDQPRGAFDLNTPYHVTSEGRLGRRVQRQIAALEAEAEEEAWAEEEADRPLPPEVAESLQASHQDAVGLQAAQTAAAARAVDEIADPVIAEQEPTERFVRRGSRHYVQIHRTKLRRVRTRFHYGNPTAVIKVSA